MLLYKISVIVPIYKVEEYINQCVNSIINQTYRNLEIILVDDGSPDKCPSICDEFKLIDNRIKIIHKKNGGLVSARKYGLEIATGDYITYVDGDDWIEATMYEDLIKHIDNNEPDIIIEGFLHDDNGTCNQITNAIRVGSYNKEDLAEKIYPYMIFSGEFYKPGIYPVLWNKLFKRNIIISNQPCVDDNISIGEDVACIYKYLLNSEYIIVSDGCHYHYRNNPEAMTKKYDAYFFGKIEVLITFLQQQLMGYTKISIDKQLNYYISYLLLHGLKQEFNPKNGRTFSLKKSTLKTFCENEFVQKALSAIDFRIIPFYDKLLLRNMKNGHFSKAYFDYICMKCINKVEKMMKITRKGWE